MNNKINEIINNFKFIGILKDIKENKQGNINSTYILTFINNDNEHKYLLQKINSYVFKDPYLVMRNINVVTNHINKKRDTHYKTLEIIETIDNDFMYTYANDNLEKEYYRAFKYMDDSISYNKLSDCNDKEMIAYETGKCFGWFHKQLDDLSSDLISESIVDFHNTKKRFDDMINAIKNNTNNRAIELADEIVILISKINEISGIFNKIGNSIPTRIVHNDTKLNNILFDKNNKSIAAIDLDTVMPGTILFDIGDGIRSTCSNAEEDEVDTSKIYLDLNLTFKYLDGYLSEMSEYLTRDEFKYIGFSIKVMTYELALRFLTDYINGDIYFKVKHKNHNKDRFINQFILLNDIESKLDIINEFIDSKYKK